MVTISQRRRHPRWRMFFTIVILSVLVRHCELASTRRLTYSSSSSSSPTISKSSSETRSPNLGSSSDLTWQAWLLLDSQTAAHSGLDSASFRRRITPKSVFIAPALPALPPCADGYRADTMGRCVKNVNIDQEAHLGFLLQRLNTRYATRGSIFESSNSHKKSSGPLQLNIPLLSGTGSQSSQFDHEETEDSIKVPVVVPARHVFTFKEEKAPSEITTHRTRSSDKEEDETTIFSENFDTSSAKEDDESAPSTPDDAVPVAEFVDDANETTFSEVVNYEIPIDLKALLNLPSLKKVNVSEELDAWGSESQLLNSTEVSPMLILLSSTAPSTTATSPTTTSTTATSTTATSTTGTSSIATSTMGTKSTATLSTSTSTTATSPTSTLSTVTSPTSTLSTGTSHTSTLSTGTSPTSTLSTGTSPTSTLSTGTSHTSTLSTGTSPTSTLSTGTSPTSTLSTGTSPTSTLSTGTSPTNTLSMETLPTATLSTATSPTTTSSTATSTTATSTTTTTTTTSPNSVISDLEDLDYGTSHHEDVWAAYVTRNITGEDIVSASVPEPVSPSKILAVLLESG